MKYKYILLLIIITLSGLLYSQVRMEGYMEAQFGKSYISDQFNWNMWDPNFFLETRFYANPVTNSKLYFKFYSDRDNNSYKSVSFNPEAVLSEGNLEFKQEKNGLGFNISLFMRESGYFWTDSSLLGVVDTGSVNDNGNAQGARLDIWHNHNGSFTYVFSDYSSGAADDVHLLRYRQSFWNSKINTGVFFQRKNYSSEGKDDYNQITALDFRLNLNRYYLDTEIAITQSPSDSAVTAMTKDYFADGIGSYYKGNIAAKAELNGLRVGKATWGYWFFKPGFYSYGDSYRNYMGDRSSNKFGYWVNSYYLVPQRAITLSLNYSSFQKIIPDTINVFLDTDNGTILKEKQVYNPEYSIYSELYIEFINGFKGKFYVNSRNNEWQGENYHHLDLFWELSVENSLAKLLTQYKLKDAGEYEEKQIAGIELSFNLSDHWKIFTRGMMASDKAEARHSIFGEIQYRIGGNAEVYLQYGPNWWGSYGLVNDDGFASVGEMKKEVKLIVKGWF